MWMQGAENNDFQFTGDTDSPLTRGLDFFLYGSGSRAIKFTNNSGPSATMQFALDSGSMTFNAGNSITITGSTLQMQGFTYPTTDGTNGQVLTTNGSKVLSFTTVSGSGGSIDTGSFATTGSNTFTGNQLINKNGAEFQMTDPTNPSYGTASFGISGPSGGLIFKQSGSTIMEGQSGNQNMTFYGNAQIQNGGLVSITGQASDGRILMLGHSGSLVLGNSTSTAT
jgi:hypothetical protein